MLVRAASFKSTSAPLTLRGPKRRGNGGCESGPWRRSYRWRRSGGRSRFRRRHVSRPWGWLRWLALLTSDAQEAQREAEADQQLSLLPHDGPSRALALREIGFGRGRTKCASRGTNDRDKERLVVRRPPAAARLFFAVHSCGFETPKAFWWFAAPSCSGDTS